MRARLKFIQKEIEEDTQTERQQVVIQLTINLNQDQVNQVIVCNMNNNNGTYEDRRNRAIENGQLDFEQDAEEFLQYLENQSRGGQQTGSNQQSSRGGSTQKDDFFKEYEWMVDMDQFDEETMQKIEHADDLDDMFYWDVDQGCEGEASGKAQDNNTSQPISEVNSNQFDNSSRRNTSRDNSYQANNQQPQQHHHHNHHRQSNSSNHHNSNYKGKNYNPNYKKQGGYANPLARGANAQVSQNPFGSNFGNMQQNGYAQQQHQDNSQRNQHHHHHQQQQPRQHTFNPLAGQQQAAGDSSTAGAADELSQSMGGVNLNKFHFNPDATSFVPSWLKK